MLNNTARKKKWLNYRAKDGILKLHLDADGGLVAFSELVTEAIRYSENDKGEFCLMDTFLSDSLSPANLEQLFHSIGNSHVKILLADPNSYFAKHRAETLNTQSFQRTVIGLERIAEALKIDRKLDFPELGNKVDLNPLINQIREKSPVDFRFYNVITSGPLYFFKNIVLSGHFSTRVSAIQFPWLMVVNDPTQPGDFFDELKEEFTHIWEKSYEQLQVGDENDRGKL